MATTSQPAYWTGRDGTRYRQHATDRDVLAGLAIACDLPTRIVIQGRTAPRGWALARDVLHGVRLHEQRYHLAVWIAYRTPPVNHHLHRLERRGLAESAPAREGMPTAWRITADGRAALADRDATVTPDPFPAAESSGMLEP